MSPTIRGASWLASAGKNNVSRRRWQSHGFEYLQTGRLAVGDDIFLGVCDESTWPDHRRRAGNFWGFRPSKGWPGEWKNKKNWRARSGKTKENSANMIFFRFLGVSRYDGFLWCFQSTPPYQDLLGFSNFWWCTQFLCVLSHKRSTPPYEEQIGKIFLGGVLENCAICRTLEYTSLFNFGLCSEGGVSGNHCFYCIFWIHQEVFKEDFCKKRKKTILGWVRAEKKKSCRVGVV